MRLPVKAVTDSELISASGSDVLPVSKGAKRSGEIIVLELTGSSQLEFRFVFMPSMGLF